MGGKAVRRGKDRGRKTKEGLESSKESRQWPSKREEKEILRKEEEADMKGYCALPAGKDKKEEQQRAYFKPGNVLRCAICSCFPVLLGFF